MEQSPILKSRAFWTAIVDAIISIGLVIIGIQWPAYKDLATQIIGFIQPVILLLIAAFTVDDTVKTWAMVRERELQAKYQK